MMRWSRRWSSVRFPCAVCGGTGGSGWRVRFEGECAGAWRRPRPGARAHLDAQVVRGAHGARDDLGVLGRAAGHVLADAVVDLPRHAVRRVLTGRLGAALGLEVVVALHRAARHPEGRAKVVRNLPAASAAPRFSESEVGAPLCSAAEGGGGGRQGAAAGEVRPRARASERPEARSRIVVEKSPFLTDPGRVFITFAESRPFVPVAHLQLSSKGGWARGLRKNSGALDET